MSDDGEEELFRDLYPELRKFAAVVGPPGTSPDDLVQEAVARALGRGPLSDLDDPLRYLRRAVANIAKNRRRQWLRRRSALARLGQPTASTDVSYPSDLADLGRLTPIERGAVYLHEVEGRPFVEVADLLGCSVESARKAASRGRAHLREDLELRP